MGQPNPIKMGAPDTYGRAEEQKRSPAGFVQGRLLAPPRNASLRMIVADSIRAIPPLLQEQGSVLAGGTYGLTDTLK
jgi:hypothetical protein